MRGLTWISAGLLLCMGAGVSAGVTPSAASQAQPPSPLALRRGINITGWFRFPSSRDPARLAAYLSDRALADIHAAGFDFVRLAVDPDVIDGAPQRAVLIAAVRRIQLQGLTVVVSPHPNDWHLETNASDCDRLLGFWQSLAPALRSLDLARTVPEVLNEPVFPKDPAAWAVLQHRVLTVIRQSLPNATIVLTGQDWGSIGGLLAVVPEDDANVLYSFHFYDPAELTSLAAYRPNLDRAALARLPFPAGDRSRCAVTAGETTDRPTADLMRYYCSLGWDTARLDATVDRAAEWGRQHHVHLLAGEFGATTELNGPARAAWLGAVHDAFETRGIGWALWGYDDVMGLGVSRPPAPRPHLDPATLTALGMTTRM